MAKSKLKQKPKTTLRIEVRGEALKSIEAIQRDSVGPIPRPTACVRAALDAIGGNIALFRAARELRAAPEQSYAGIVTHALAQAIRIKQFEKGRGK